MNPTDDNSLQIVHFSVPYPANYGGAIDTFYRIQALAEMGIKIYLHCFTYNREPQIELEEMAAKVYYYPRSMSAWLLFHSLPYIVASRKSRTLLDNLAKVKAPILFEGVHTTGWIGHPLLRDHPKWVRTHNIESNYYQQLAKGADNWKDRWYYKLESLKLQFYEHRMPDVNGIFCISREEQAFFQKHYPKVVWLPAFHKGEALKAGPEPGRKGAIAPFLLYHGDLSISLNAKVALQLLKNWRHEKIRLCIAGKMPDSFVEKAKNRNWQQQLIPNPTDEQMHDLMQAASGHIIVAAHGQGVKLKLIHALFSGKVVFANENAVRGSGLEASVIRIQSVEELLRMLERESWSDLEGAFSMMDSQLEKWYDNLANARKLWSTIKRSDSYKT